MTPPQLAMSVWLQYYLDNFATVADAVEWTKTNNPQVIPMSDPTGGSQPAIHLALDDAQGDSVIFEYIDGELKVHHSRDYLVMTNSPSYDQQLELVKKFQGWAATTRCRAPAMRPTGSRVRCTTSTTRTSRPTPKRPSPRCSASSATPPSRTARRTWVSPTHRRRCNRSCVT